eukprot:m.746407 g.746407  ORF g.746407 m.746407 type:complete len:594 (+) comp23136_c0_seq6:186-1967(+)
MSSKEGSGSGRRKKLVAQDYSALFTKMATTIDEKEAKKQTEEENTIVNPDEDEQMDMAAMMGFAGFGKKGEDKELKKKQQADMIASTKRIPVDQKESDAPLAAATPDTPSTTSATKVDSNESEDDGDDVDGIEAQDSLGIPVSHEVTLKHGERPISAMDIDPSGARVVTGSFDYKVKLWDFAAMDARMRSFREVEPFEGVQVRKLLFNNTGDLIVVCTGNATPKVVDRDGFDVVECLKGDQYFNDLSKTYGHVSLVNDATWHPTKKNLFITCSADSTVRVWNTDSTQLNNTLKSSICGKCRARNGKRAGILSVAISPVCGKLVVVGCEGGSIQSFSLGDRMMIPKQQHHGAHAEGTDVTCLRFSRDGRLLSRSTDGTVKLWNAKKLTQGPTYSQGDLPCYYSMTECVFSPDEQYVLTGLSGPDVGGVLVLLDGHNLTPVRRFGLAGTGIGVIRIKWHPRINQILCSLSKGHTKVLFDNDKSFRGAKFCVSKAPRKANALDAVGVESFGSVEGKSAASHVEVADGPHLLFSPVFIFVVPCKRTPPFPTSIASLSPPPTSRVALSPIVGDAVRCHGQPTPTLPFSDHPRTTRWHR